MLSLHRNEYHFQHAPKVCQLLAGPVPTALVSSYASRETLDEFVHLLAAALNIAKQQFTLYHGAEDALFKILSWAAARRMAVHTTSWGWAEYMRMMQGLELEVLQTPLRRQNQSFEHPTEEFEADLAKATQPALVLLASPNNPTGHMVSHGEILRLARRFPQHTFLIDQVYTEFASHTFAPLTECANIITLGSFSKFFGLPGLRVGFAIGRVPAVQSMALGPAPWSLQLCRAAIEETKYYASNWCKMHETAKHLQATLSPAGLFMRTSAPFVLFRCDPRVEEKNVVAAQKEAQVRGKTLTAEGQLYVRWSLGSPDAQKRILQSVAHLEANL